jgi:uncharacterized protein (DUF305 family)
VTKGVIPCILVVLTFAGCSGGSDDPAATGETAPNIVQPGAPGQGTRTLTPEELEDIERTEHVEADVRFMQGMIHHHAQAIRMTSLVPTHTKRRAITLIAKRIDLSQESEIEQMRKWLEARDEPAPELHRVHGHAHGIGQAKLMPGMLTEAQLKRLAAVRGAAFDRRFLEAMIYHHAGAVKMVDDLYTGGAGAEPEIDAFARHVDADQRIEISRMQRLLGVLETDDDRRGSSD